MGIFFSKKSNFSLFDINDELERFKSSLIIKIVNIENKVKNIPNVNSQLKLPDTKLNETGVADDQLNDVVSKMTEINSHLKEIRQNATEILNEKSNLIKIELKLLDFKLAGNNHNEIFKVEHKISKFRIAIDTFNATLKNSIEILHNIKEMCDNFKYILEFRNKPKEQRDDQFEKDFLAKSIKYALEVRDKLNSFISAQTKLNIASTL